MAELRRSKRRMETPPLSNGHAPSPGLPNAKKMRKSVNKQSRSTLDSTLNAESSSSGGETRQPSKVMKSNSSLLLNKKCPPSGSDFSSIENSIFAGVSRLSESGSSSDSDFEEVYCQSDKANPVKSIPAKADRRAASSSMTMKNLNSYSKPLSESTAFSSTPDDNVAEENKGSEKRRSSRNVNSSNGKYQEIVLKNVKEGNCEMIITNDRICETSPQESRSSRGSKSNQKRGTNKGKKSTNECSDEISQAPKQAAEKYSSPAMGNMDKTKQCNLSGGNSASGQTTRVNVRSKVSNKVVVKSSTGRKIKKNMEIPNPAIKMEIPEKVDQLDISQLLALGEGIGESSKSHPSDSESEDWEEVEAADVKEPVLPKGGVEITVKMPELFRHRKKQDFQACLRAEINRNFNRARRELQLLLHEASLLGWLAHGIFVNTVLRSDSLRALSLSLIPIEHCNPSGKPAKRYVDHLLKWFCQTIECSEGFSFVDDQKYTEPLLGALEQQFSRKTARSQKELTFMFITVLRALGMEGRLVISLQPMPLKPPGHDLLPINSKIKSKGNQSQKQEKAEKSVDLPQKAKDLIRSEKSSPKKVKNSGSPGKSEKSKIAPKSIPEKLMGKKSTSKSPRPDLQSSRKSHPSSPNSLSSKKSRECRERSFQKSYVEDSEPEDRSSSENPNPKPILSPEKGKSLDCDEKERLIAAAAKRVRGIRKISSINTKRSKPSTSRKTDPEDSHSDSDFEPKPRNSKGKGLRVLSSDEDKTQLICNGFDYWAEVYLEGEERWVPIDVPSRKVDNVKQIVAKASQPPSYVVAFNADGTVKDVTRRYAPKFSQVTVKLRVPQKWWDNAMKAFKPKRTKRDIQEDSKMNMVELDRPIPTKVGECKNHPLYALKRHLLKFEAIYPPDAPTLGFLPNGEAIYARQNIYTLHSREIWMKDAKVVRLGEKPYKIVKARPKYDRLNGKVITDLPLEIFGPWQVEDYIPPPAVDGKVPRNAYGNVELFKPTMLPRGCVHLQVPGLNRVAKKLKIDCAPAVVGFDYHSGGCHPTYDGFVVCEEFVDVLMDAWNKDIDESAKRREEKHEKRIYGNWRRLIKGLLIREALKYRYNFKEESVDDMEGSSSTGVNAEALESARITEETPAPPSLFPKLMARIRSNKRTPRSIKESRSAKKEKPIKKNVQRNPKRKKSESSEEEVETDWESSSTSLDEMVLLSEEDTDSDIA